MTGIIRSTAGPGDWKGRRGRHVARVSSSSLGHGRPELPTALGTLPLGILTSDYTSSQRDLPKPCLLGKFRTRESIYNP
jgi:hypothetical protein